MQTEFFKEIMERMTESLGFYRYQLETYQKTGVLTSLFVDPENPDDFIAGYVAHVNRTQVLLYAVSPVGRYDGLLACRLNQISTIMGEDDYSMRLRRLLLLRRDMPKEQIDVQPEEDIFHAMCRKAAAEDRVITIWIGEAEYAGRVRALDDMRVTIGVLDFFGANPADVPLAFRQIDMASIGAEDDEMYQLLSDNGLPDEKEL
jgi:hypothetical protein